MTTATVIFIAFVVGFFLLVIAAINKDPDRKFKRDLLGRDE